MNENQNNSNRPRVVWKDGKCIIYKPDRDTAQVQKREQQTTGRTPVKTAALAHTAKRVQSTPVKSQKRETADTVGVLDFLSGLKYKRSMIAAVLIIAVLSVTAAAVSSALSARTNDETPTKESESVSVQSELDTEYTAPTPLASDDFAVCIDPGHGYDDVGTSNDELGVYEHDVVLNVGLKLRDKLKDAGIKVYMTHDTNERPPEASEPYLFGMTKRNGLANSLSDVDLFISIHCDAYYEDPSISGPRVYHMSDDKGGEGVASAISETLAVFEEDREIIVKPMTGMNSYQVLRDSDMPAVLVETGFLSNPEEGAEMLTDEWAENMAGALADAIIKSFEDGVIGA